MNFKQLCQTLGREAGVSGAANLPTTDDQTGEVGRVVEWIRSAYTDLQSLFSDWRFLWASTTLTAVAGQSEYDGPADLGILDRDKVRLDGRPIQVIDYELWDFVGTPHEAQPYQVVLMPNKKLRLHPTPDKAYTLTLDYYKAHQTLSADTDVPILPEQFHDLIWMQALLKYAYYESAPEVAERVSREMPRRLAAMESSELPGRRRYQLGQDPNPLVVVPE